MHNSFRVISWFSIRFIQNYIIFYLGVIPLKISIGARIGINWSKRRKNRKKERKSNLRGKKKRGKQAKIRKKTAIESWVKERKKREKREEKNIKNYQRRIKKKI